jgi:DNA polymerase-3 subunit delta
MTALRAAEADRVLARPESAPRVILLYGPDPGGVTERAVLVTEKLVGADPFAVVRLDADEMGSEPGRLADEVFGGSLFAGRRVVRLRAGSRNVAPAVAPILERPPEQTWLVIEAGDLRKTSPLRKLCEDSRNAAAIGCYPDNDAALGRMVEDEVRAAGLTIDADARELLVSLVGADRAASRSEIRKLCLYAADAGVITAADIAAVIGDGAAYAIDGVVDAALLGQPAEVDRGLRRLLAAGTSPSAIATAAERTAMQLHRLRAAVEAGASIATVLQGLRPPPIPSRRQTLEAQLRRWPLAALDAAVTRFGTAVERTRLHPANAAGIVGDALAGVAARAARSG